MTALANPAVLAAEVASLTAQLREALAAKAANEQRIAELMSANDELEALVLCNVCMEQSKSVRFSCGHTACETCAAEIDTCHICRQRILGRAGRQPFFL